jgi:FkbM family methyltransferase
LNIYRAFRRGTIFKAVLGREPFYWVPSSKYIVEMGSSYGAWAVDSRLTHSDSKVFCFGLGEDVTFELALMKRFDCGVFGFDPTPRSVKYLANEVHDERLKTFALAISDYDGTVKFNLPPETMADQVSASGVANYQNETRADASAQTFEAPCVTLRSAMQLCQQTKVDILKMDIEGSEYAVLEQAIKEGWLQSIQQILVEFHHFLPGLEAGQTKKIVASLKQNGYRIAWIGRTNHEYLFTRGS